MNLNPEDGSDYIGEMVRVFWKNEEEWFQGVIDDFDPARGYHVQYFDAEDEWVRNLLKLINDEISYSNYLFSKVAKFEGGERGIRK